MASEVEAGSSNANHVYVVSDEFSWMPARVVEYSKTEPNKVLVSIAAYKDEDSIQSGNSSSKGQGMAGARAQSTTIAIDLSTYPNRSLPLQNVNEDGLLQQVEDMVDLPFLHEPAILYNLKARHAQGKPYTRTGDIVIAVNPYQWMMDLYSEQTRATYAHALVWNHDAADLDPRTTVPPHVYETSSLAYRGLAVDGQDQSILVSGESGAGKTETVKILMSHLASIQAAALSSHAFDSQDNQHSHHVPPIVQRVLDSNPLLEAFGNAKTIRNDNSSRFGKYLQLQFDTEDPDHAAYAGKAIPSCMLAGSKCEVYLLEKSRVVGHEEDERSYHIFYQILAASEEEKAAIWTGLKETDNESFLYVGYTDTDTIEGKTDAARFALTKQALALIGIDNDRFVVLMRAICVVMQLGNQTFELDPHDDERSVISSAEELLELSNLMGVDPEIITRALTERTVRARNEVFTVPLKPDQAKDSADALAKEIYAKTFLWIVRNINDATAAEWNYEGDKKANFGIIGLLDIFGFESFKVNRFEQLCINYANEKLQQKFTQDVFCSVQTEYEFEGIALGEIQYEDNADVLNLVEGRMGLIAVLNEECVRPKGSDSAFVSKVHAVNKDSDAFYVEKSFRAYEFGIKHYAGRVYYDATGFVSKNMDALPLDLLECAKKSSNEIIANELQNDAMMNDHTRTKPKRVAPSQKTASTRLVHQTVWTKFRSQLTSLMLLLSETRTRYIRCIKPNTRKEPRSMMHLSTVEQLRCAGVVAAVTISRSAFPNRLQHEIVLERFKSLWAVGEHHGDGVSGEPASSTKSEIEILLSHALKSLQTIKDGDIVMPFVIGKTRTYFRAGALEHLEAERLKGLSNWATEIQRIARGFVAKSKFQKKRRQLSWQLRPFAGLLSVVDIFEHVMPRLSFSVPFVVSKPVPHCMGAVEAMARGAIQRPRFRFELKERQEEAKLENQLKILQRKLEEAELRRIEAEKKAAERPQEVYPTAIDDGAGKKDKIVTPAIGKAGTESTDSPTLGLLTTQQQNLMDESGKMLEYLRKEVFKLRNQNSQLRTDFDLLKENNQRLMDANASAGASFAALNQHAKQLNKQNSKLSAELSHCKQLLHKASLTQVEVKEELKMKQATYVAEVHSRLQYQKTMTKIVDTIQARCKDTRLVEDVLQMADDCEEMYMNGPTSLTASTSILGSLTPTATDLQDTTTSIVSRFKSFFG
ncbi:myosin-kinesin ATPase superfamily-like protein [Fragilaria crotonensis]|nr:myosin-kinesin ATPase superfamily-like protein [Fragilaria crotonensis]